MVTKASGFFAAGFAALFSSALAAEDLPSVAAPKDRQGTYVIMSVVPPAGVYSQDDLNRAKKIVGKTVTIQGPNVTVAGKKCLIDTVGGELLADQMETATGHYERNWAALGLKRWDKRYYKVQTIGTYCPGTSKLTAKDRARIDFSKIDEYTAYKFGLDQHVIFVANGGQLIIMEYAGHWVRLKKRR